MFIIIDCYLVLHHKYEINVTLWVVAGRASGVKMGDDGDGSLISPDGVAPIWMVGESSCVIFPYTIKVQKKISSGTGSPG